MKRSISFTVLTVLVAGICFASEDSVKGWKKTGDLQNYQIGIDNQEKFSGKNCAFIKSKGMSSEERGFLTQSISPEMYFNKKVKVTGYAKISNDVKDGIFYLQAVSDDKNLVIEHAKINSANWKKYSLVIQIPEKTKKIIYGVWIDDFDFSEFRESTNLDFEE